MTRKDFLSLGLLIAFPFFFLSGTLTSGQTFFMRDLTYLFHPWRSLAAQMIQGGTLPTWNDYAMGGMPFLANCQSAILYPFSVLFWILHFPLALKAFYLLHYFLAAVGFYLFARKLKASPAAALIGSLIFAYNGYMLTRLEFLSVLGSLIWVPWLGVFASARRSFGLSFRAVLLGITLTFPLLAGYPQIFLLSAMAAGLYSLYDRPSLQNVRFWALASVVFAILAAAQLLPTAELISQSIRGGEGVPFSEAVTYSLPVDSLFGLIYPFRILHNPDRFTGEKFFWIWSAWWGICASVLVFVSLFARRKKILIFPATLVLVGILWSMGDQFPWFETLFKHVPVVRMFRYPPVALYWTVFGIAWLGLAGTEALKQCSLKFPRLGKMLLAAAAVMVFAELQYYSRDLLPTVRGDYYHVTFQAIRAAQADDGTAMLSPKVNSVRRLPGMTSEEAKMKFRGFLFDLTNLPYRIRSIVPSGEPLALASYHAMYRQLEDSKSVEQARPLLNLWNVTHFLTTDELSGDWKLEDAGADLKVYTNPEALGRTFGISDSKMQDLKRENFIYPKKFHSSPDGISAVYGADKLLTAVFNVPFYPGWKIYCACAEHGFKPLETFKVQNYFLAAAISAGEHPLYVHYEPKMLNLGLALTVLGAASLAAVGFSKLKGSKAS